MSTIILSTGSNMGDRQANLAAAAQRVAHSIGPVLNISGVYQTAAWGMTDQPSFLNQAIKAETSLTPVEVLEQIASIEQDLGRIRAQKWGPRTIDIDLLYYGSEIIQSDHLIVPHPGISQRRFVLEPLMDIAADWVHPVLQLTTRELLDQTSDHLAVHRVQS